MLVNYFDIPGVSIVSIMEKVTARPQMFTALATLQYRLHSNHWSQINNHDALEKGWPIFVPGGP